MLLVRGVAGKIGRMTKPKIFRAVLEENQNKGLHAGREADNDDRREEIFAENSAGCYRAAAVTLRNTAGHAWELHRFLCSAYT